MHQSSLRNMTAFRDTYLSDRKEEVLNILDLGSMDVNGAYRQIFDTPPWKYLGADLSPGRNVDVVLENPYKWSVISAGSTDVLISGQAFEHIEFFWQTMLEIARVLRPNGLCCLIAPSSGFEHRYPVDCWRFYPDGFKALARFAGLTLLECHCRQEPGNYTDDSNLWKDTVLVARKPVENLLRRWKRRALHRVMQTMIKDRVKG